MSQCHVCKKVFCSNSEVKQHMKFIHSDEKPYTCKICESPFKTAACLQRHEKTHLEMKPHKCSYCGRSFRPRYHCRYHEATHDETQRHTCNTCGSSFAKASDLNRHMRTMHTSAGYPFKCKTCGRGFPTENL